MNHDFSNPTRKYLRNTHLNGFFRKEMEDSVWCKIPCGFSGVVHLLSSENPMSLADIISESHGYAHDFPMENNSKIETDPYILMEVLELLVNFDMVKVVEENSMNTINSISYRNSRGQKFV